MHRFMEADVHWYQPVRVKGDESKVPAEALAVVQPFHPGVMNILFPYEGTLTKMRQAKKRDLLKPLHGRYGRADAAASSSSQAPPQKSPRTR